MNNSRTNICVLERSVSVAVSVVLWEGEQKEMGLCMQPSWLCTVWGSGMVTALCHAAVLHFRHGDPVSSAVGTKFTLETNPIGWIIEATVGVSASWSLHG